jgi:hypothetical protein
MYRIFAPGLMSVLAGFAFRNFLYFPLLEKHNFDIGLGGKIGFPEASNCN